MHWFGKNPILRYYYFWAVSQMTNPEKFPFMIKIHINFKTLKDDTTNCSHTVSNWLQIQLSHSLTDIVLDRTFLLGKSAEWNNSLNLNTLGLCKYGVHIVRLLV